MSNVDDFFPRKSPRKRATIDHSPETLRRRTLEAVSRAVDTPGRWAEERTWPLARACEDQIGRPPTKRERGLWQRELDEMLAMGLTPADTIATLEAQVAALKEALEECVEALRPYAFVYDAGMMDEDNNYPVLDAINKAEALLPPAPEESEQERRAKAEAGMTGEEK